MLALSVLIFFMAVATILGAKRWQRKSTKYLVIAIVALLQTVLVAINMFTMKIPKG
jgi:O-antigen ligase